MRAGRADSTVMGRATGSYQVTFVGLACRWGRGSGRQVPSKAPGQRCGGSGPPRPPPTEHRNLILTAVWACRLASSRTFRLAHPQGRSTRVASPSTTTASPTSVISASHWRRSARLVMKVPSGWQYPTAASSPSSRSRLSPTSVWRSRPCGRRAGMTARPAVRRQPRPSGPPTPTAGSRPARAGVVAAGGRGDRPARPARVGRPLEQPSARRNQAVRSDQVVDGSKQCCPLDRHLQADLPASFTHRRGTARAPT
jgi:hypothetical protein